MKVIFLFLVLLWFLSYIIATIQMVKAKERIALLNIVLIFLFPAFWIFFRRPVARCEDYLISLVK